MNDPVTFRVEGRSENLGAWADFVVLDGRLSIMLGEFTNKQADNSIQLTQIQTAELCGWIQRRLQLGN